MRFDEFETESGDNGGPRALHPEGNFLARLADMWQLPSKPGKDGKPYAPFQHVFLTGEKDDEGRDIWLWYQTSAKLGTNPQTGVKARLRLMEEALLYRTLGDDEAYDVFNTDNLIGKYGLLDVKHVPRKGSKELSARVEGVSRVPKAFPVTEISLATYARPQKYRSCKPEWPDDSAQTDFSETP